MDGKPREAGVVDFLGSRGISLTPGSAADSSEDTVSGLCGRKQQIFLESLHAGVPVFESTVVRVRKLADAGVATGIYSSSRNCEHILKDAGLGDLFTVRVDGVVAQDMELPGKPDPAVLLEATRRLGAVPQRSVVIEEDAEAGVDAGSRADLRSSSASTGQVTPRNFAVMAPMSWSPISPMSPCVRVTN